MARKTNRKTPSEAISPTPRAEHQTIPELQPITVTIPVGCRVSGLGRSTIYRLLDAGEIDSVKVGKRRLIILASLQTRLTQTAA